MGFHSRIRRHIVVGRDCGNRESYFETGKRRRAMVVVTDGVDSASRMKPAEVSAIASALDVPVYVIVISFSLEDEARDPTPTHGPTCRILRPGRADK